MVKFIFVYSLKYIINTIPNVKCYVIFFVLFFV